MSDIRSRLADALREHQLGLSDEQGFHCVSINCDWTGHNYDIEEHQADVLLSLPPEAHIAIIERAWRMSFQEEFGSLPPEKLLLGLRAVLASFDQEGGEEAMEDPAALAASIYVLGRAVEHLLAKELEPNEAPPG